MSRPGFVLVPHGGRLGMDAVLPVMPVEDFRAAIITQARSGRRLAALFGMPAGTGTIRLLAAMAAPEEGGARVACADVSGSYPSLTPDCPQAHYFEREIFERWGVKPSGHPWLKPVRSRLPDEPQFFRMRGEEAHEVGVGPVHAGVIEPGHFRFQCHGEDVLHLEIALGWQHRGVERALAGGPGPRTMHYMETLAGDTSVGHATAYCEALEALAGSRVPPRAQALRAIALELERLANHTGDLGAMAGDVGFLPTLSFCGRLRGDFLNLTARLCGSRFGRGFVRPGGVRFDVDDRRAAEIRERLDAALRDVAGAVNLLWAAPSVMSRFEGTGRISRETAMELGLVGVAARASGLERDSRKDAPSGMFRFQQMPVSTWRSGDVFGRAYVRWLEIQRSGAFVRDLLSHLPVGDIRVPVDDPAADSIALPAVEGWRGEIRHVAVTGGDGRFAAYKVVDPSFQNWFGLAMAMRGQPISDFPLCNKSFNLSYAGHDL